MREGAEGTCGESLAGGGRQVPVRPMDGSASRAPMLVTRNRSALYRRLRDEASTSASRSRQGRGRRRGSKYSDDDDDDDEDGMFVVEMSDLTAAKTPMLGAESVAGVGGRDAVHPAWVDAAEETRRHRVIVRRVVA